MGERWVGGATRLAGVMGWPIEHSLSPVIHNAGYAAAGLSSWSYGAQECGEAELPGLVAGLGDVTSDWLINCSDVVFHMVLTAFVVALAAGAWTLAARLRRREPAPA